MAQTIKVLLASPSYDGRFDVRFLTSLTETIKLCSENNIEVLPYYLCFDSLVQRARNDYLYSFYHAKDLDVLFFIDSDIGWDPKDFVKLVLSDKDMIGATYRKKTDDEELYAFKAMGDNGKFEITPDKDGILKVSGLGCGFLKLSRKCVEKLFESETSFYLKDDGGLVKNICDCVINSDNRFVSEDITMGFKWMNLNESVYLDTTINCIHSGNKAYTGNVQNWLADWRIKLGQSSPKPKYAEFFKMEQAPDDFKVL